MAARVECGETAAYHRHRRRRETVCEPCRQAWNAHNRDRRRRAKAAQREARAASTIWAARDVDRLTIRVHLPTGPVGFGALAGTTRPHPFVPDRGTGTLCRLCFGWCTDYRRLGMPATQEVAA